MTTTPTSPNSMIPDSEGLHEIANTTNRDREADIVFVHGLGGASHATWRHGQEGKDGHFFWPEELGKDLPHCGIWTVGYPAGFTALGKPGMIIEKRAGNLSQKLTNAGLGVRPLLFITHSMGGLVVKSLIVGSQTLADADRKRLVSMIRGIVFCATPHRGSAFADAAGVLGQFLGGSQDHVNEMRANAEPLDILHDQFIEWHRNHTVPIESYAENIGLFRTRRWLRPLPLGLVVPRASANPGIAGHTVRDVDDDHLTLVKPRDRRNDVYAGVLRFVRAALTVVSPERTNVTPADRPPVVPAPKLGVNGVTAVGRASREATQRVQPNPSSEIMSKITVFISYSHDSDEHREKVLALSERLRADGIATILDRYVEKSSPPEGWPRWMMNGLNAATHVLCVCTETYRRRFLGQEVPGKGKGADWEGALVNQALYDARSHTNKFIPVLFARSDESHIPEPLRPQTHYLLDSEASYQALYDALLDQAGVGPGTVGELKRKPRATGRPLDFGGTPGAPASAVGPTSRAASNRWQEKLEFLLVEDAICVDPAMKFRLKHLITEAQDKIRSLGREG